MHHIISQLLSILYYTIIFLFIHSTPLISMDASKTQSSNINTKKKIDIKLDDGSTYPIETWKVKKESNTLCECYYSQGKKNPIVVNHISKEEITLFDKALDKHIDYRRPKSFSKYFKKLSPDKQRTLTIVAGQQSANGTKKLCVPCLTAQLAVQWLDHSVVYNSIIKKYCPEQFTSLFMYLKSCMIIDNIHNNLIIQSPAYSYSQDDCLKKETQGGSFIFAPKIEDLNMHNFGGQPSIYLFKDLKNTQYRNILFTTKTNHLIVQAQDRDGTIIDEALLLHKDVDGQSNLVKTIVHASPIMRASFSPDGKWFITSSSAMMGRQNSKLMLTYLGNSPDNPYLSDTIIVPNWNFNSAPQFNNASTLLAYGKPGQVQLFSLQEKKVVNTLELPSTPSSKPWPLEITFNHDDTRLIACLEHGRNNNKHTFMIWNVSNLNDIKVLQSLEISTKRSPDATITFNYPQRNTIVISTMHESFFFDTVSGAFLGRTTAETEENNIHGVAACSIPHTSITCIATTNSDLSNCVNLYNHTSGKCVGTIPFTQPSIVGIGMTKNGRSLVTTFDKYKAITTQLITDKGIAPIVELSTNMNLITFYALIELLKSKKENSPVHISQSLYEYIRDFFVEGQSYKEIIQKYLC